jgi:hypothetical protein
MGKNIVDISYIGAIKRREYGIPQKHNQLHKYFSKLKQIL